MWNPYLEEFVPSETASETETSATSRLDTEGESYAEGESDMPIFYPMPFKEESSRTVYSLEEQKHRLADSLMTQFQRHYFLRRPGQRTVAAVTPNVNTYQIFAKREAEYVLEALIKPYALAIPEIDQRLEKRRKQLLEAATGRVAGQDIEPTTRG